jgi:hypothetical protein
MHIPSAAALTIMLAPFALWGALFCLAEYAHVSLKSLSPWFPALYWFLWGAAGIGVLVDHPLRFALISAYGGIGLVLGWLKRRYLFESSMKPSRSLASLLTIPQPTYVAVRDVSTAFPWYTEKFGLRKLSPTEETRSDGVTLQFNESTHPVILIPKDPSVSRSAPVFFARNVEKVRNRLIADGVSAGPVHQDRQGTNFFELLDGEGNTLEVSERP